MLAGFFYGDEGEVFNEAVKEILAKHKSKINTEWITRYIDEAAQNHFLSALD